MMKTLGSSKVDLVKCRRVFFLNVSCTTALHGSKLINLSGMLEAWKLIFHARHCLYLSLVPLIEQPNHSFWPLTPFLKWREALLGQRLGIYRGLPSRKYI